MRFDKNLTLHACALLPLSAFVAQVWAADVITAPTTYNGLYRIEPGLTITPTGVFSINPGIGAAGTMLRGSGTVTVDVGVLTSPATASGFFGSGEFKVINGGDAFFSSLGLGFETELGSQKTLVDGTGSSVNAAFLYVAGRTDAQLTITNGATLNATRIYLGGRPIGTVSNPNYGAVSQKSGVLNVGAAEGGAAQTPGQINSRILTFTSPNGELVFNHTSDNFEFSTTLSSDPAGSTAGVAGRWGTIKVFAGTTRLTGNNSGFGGVTNVSGGTLIAGAANALGSSSVNVASGATLKIERFNQTVRSLNNSGLVSIYGGEVGTVLTINGAYIGNNGAISFGRVSNDGLSDLLIIDGPSSAVGHTSLSITDVSGLGGATSGDGIEIVSARNGATTTAQTTKDAFSLKGGYIDAGAFQYRLYSADINGNGENWYLRSLNSLGVPTYRSEASLFSAVPAQVRLGNLAMLGDMHKRIGDDEVSGRGADASSSDHRVWTRMVSSEMNVSQSGDTSSKSKGRFNGFQVGADLVATSNWKVGVYIGQLEGGINVDGAVGGVYGERAGNNMIRSEYIGAYSTYTAESGFYVDAVLQSGNHKYTVESDATHSRAKGRSLVESIEIGKPFALGKSLWSIEPQLQLIHQSLDLKMKSFQGRKSTQMLTVVGSLGLVCD